MSREIDLTKPLSDADRKYLEDRARHADIALADANSGVEGKSELPAPNVFAATDPSPDRTPAASISSTEDAEEDLPYEEWKVDELKAELDVRAQDAEDSDIAESLAYTSSDKKADLIKKLEADDARE